MQSNEQRNKQNAEQNDKLRNETSNKLFFFHFRSFTDNDTSLCFSAFFSFPNEQRSSCMNAAALIFALLAVGKCKYIVIRKKINRLRTIEISKNILSGDIHLWSDVCSTLILISYIHIPTHSIAFFSAAVVVVARKRIEKTTFTFHFSMYYRFRIYFFPLFSLSFSLAFGSTPPLHLCHCRRCTLFNACTQCNLLAFSLSSLSELP